MIYRSKPEEPLRELFARLIDSGKAFVVAEVALVRQTATGWAAVAKFAGAMLAAALLFLIVGLVVLFMALGWTLAIWLGPAGGLAVAALVALVIAGVCAWLGIRRISAGIEA